MNYDVTGLFANTMYEFQIVAKNTRKEKFPDKDDASEASVVEGKTKGESRLLLFVFRFFFMPWLIRRLRNGIQVTGYKNSSQNFAKEGTSNSVHCVGH